jgi:hypothetical protein
LVASGLVAAIIIFVLGCIAFMVYKAIEAYGYYCKAKDKYEVIKAYGTKI